MSSPSPASRYHNEAVQGVGIGLRHRHFDLFNGNARPDVPWLEVHTENFFSSGSAASQHLLSIREHYPLSLHCVGLSLGSAEPVDATHLARVKECVERYEPTLVSDHVSWNMANHTHLPDLLPVPYTEEALEALVRNIQQTQEYLGRTILIENPSSYLSFTESHIPEPEFLMEAAKRSGCQLLLDINNIAVTAHNHGLDAAAYIDSIDPDYVKEIHLAGYAVQEVEGQARYIDDHGARVYPEVWELYDYALARLGAVPTLIEWDTHVPELAVLLEEKTKADNVMTARFSDASPRVKQG